MTKQLETVIVGDVTLVILREPDLMSIGLAVCNPDDPWDTRSGRTVAEWRARTPRVLGGNAYHTRIPYTKAPDLKTLVRLAYAQANTRDTLAVMRMGFGIA